MACGSASPMPTRQAAAYRELAARIGPRALVAPMVRNPGIEMLLGMIRDEQFGPVVVMGSADCTSKRSTTSSICCRRSPQTTRGDVSHSSDCTRCSAAAVIAVRL